MALTAAQKVILNGILAQYPSSSTNPTLLADMWEAITAPALKATYKAETLAKIAAFQAGLDAPFTSATDAVNAA